MAVITITVPDKDMGTLLDAFENLCPIPVDEMGVPIYDRTTWVQMRIREHIRDVWKSHVIPAAVDAARAAALAQADTDTADIVVAQAIDGA